jgi:hypothetical protein
MNEITERTMLLRGSTALPDDLKLATVEFGEGWNLVRSGDAPWLDKQVRNCGWHFIWIAEKSQKGGVGQTVRKATAIALKLALRSIGKQYNAAEVENIRLTKYPWFYLASVRIYPYNIQQSANLSLSSDSPSLLIHPSERAAAVAASPLPTVFSSGIGLSH